MRYLLDTNILIFLMESNHKLDRNVQSIINDYTNKLYVSVVSILEFIHLFQKGRVSVHYESLKGLLNFLESFGLKLNISKRN